MTLQEFYTELGSDYENVFKQIPSERMILKFVNLYAQDPSITQLQESIKKEAWNDAFRAAHTLKGVALNLGLDHLAAAASALTENLRGGKPLSDHSLVEEVQKEHQAVLSALQKLQ